MEIPPSLLQVSYPKVLCTPRPVWAILHFNRNGDEQYWASSLVKTEHDGLVKVKDSLGKQTGLIRRRSKIRTYRGI